MQERSLDLRSEVLGARHPEVLQNMQDLYCTWYEEGRFGEIEPLAAPL